MPGGKSWWKACHLKKKKKKSKLSPGKPWGCGFGALRGRFARGMCKAQAVGAALPRIRGAQAG